LEITADLSGEKVVDLSMAWNSGSSIRRAVHVYGVLSTFPEKLTAMLLEVPDQIAPLHAA
jgi:hypothetical protein